MATSHLNSLHPRFRAAGYFTGERGPLNRLMVALVIEHGLQHGASSAYLWSCPASCESVYVMNGYTATQLPHAGQASLNGLYEEVRT